MIKEYYNRLKEAEESLEAGRNFLKYKHVDKCFVLYRNAEDLMYLIKDTTWDTCFHYDLENRLRRIRGHV